jgi:predicted secreted hydrolase
MKTLNLHCTALVLLLLAYAALDGCGPCGVQAGEEWLQAVEPRDWNFPRDHGAHPAYRTEWWYFTGNLSDESARQFGYQLTFFRFGVRGEIESGGNPWQVRDLYMAHFTVTEVEENNFSVAERISRAGPGLAGARTDRMDVWIFNWSAVMSDSVIFLEARDGALELNLTLTPVKPLVFHGENGLSRKGAGTGQASYYTSFTSLETRGFLRMGENGSQREVQGTSWFDHEFGSNQLAQNQEGWDWFSLHLSDGRDLMLYFLRKAAGIIEPASSGTLVEADGTARHLPLEAVSLAVLDRWESPASGGKYPGRWKIRIPECNIELVIAPLVRNQELITSESTGVIYWEGAVGGSGISKGRKVTAEGYVELTGYAGSMGGVF